MKIDQLTLEQKVGQMLMFAFHGTEYNEQLETFIKEFNLGGVVLFARNIMSPLQVANLNQRIQADTNIPLFISLDQEGGPVQRIIDGITPLPGAMALASADQDKIYDITKAVGHDLKSLGFNMNFAPVGDVNNNPDNPVINSRSYSDSPRVVAKCAKMAYRGFQDSDIIPTIKHFPGHGNTNVDSHLGLPVVKSEIKEIEKIELIPFIETINDGIAGVMVSHILYEAYDKIYPATLSYQIITKLLKEELGFKGLICTDSLTMGAIYTKFSVEEILYHGINAGNDMLVFCGRADLNEQRFIYNTFIKLVSEGKIPMARINESVDKILNLKAKYCRQNINLGAIRTPENLALSNELQDKSITLVNDNNLLPLKKNDKVLLIFPEIKLFSLVDNENQKYETLNNYLDVDEIIINQDLKNLSLFKSISDKYDKIVMATYNVVSGDYQTKVYDYLDKEKLVVVSLRSPYDINHLPGAKNYLCIYEATKEALMSLSKALRGDILFKGKLPINLEGGKNESN